jgi:hypothetical protein
MRSGRRELRSPRCSHDCLDDVPVPGAAAEVACDFYPNILFCRVGLLAEKGVRRQQQARCAEPALKRMGIRERLLKSAELVTVGEAFDRRNRAPINLRGEGETGAYRHLVEEDRARAAHAVLAPEVGPRQQELVAKEVRENQPGWDHTLVEESVDSK